MFYQYLGQIILAFFDDILIYSCDFDTHLQNLRASFDILRKNQLFIKKEKCSFAQK